MPAMTNENIKYHVGFNRISGIGRVRLGQLEKYFNSLKAAWLAPARELKNAGLDENTVAAIVRQRDSVSPDTEMEKLSRLNIQTVSLYDEAYPARLKEIYDCPPLLYIKGTITASDDISLAVVGTRRATAYGKQVTEEIITELARNKVTIVSGLARGIDTAAHKAALEAGGRSIAVLGGGLDAIYPSENTALAAEITRNGAIISEYPVGSRPRPENFPRRNRILSGLSLGVLAIEAGEASGALITANLALEQNREVFAIPGNIFSPYSCGTNRLIQEGAKMVTNYKDILEELNLTEIARQLEMREVLPVTETEKLILDKLGTEPCHIDQLCRTSGLPAATVSGMLTMLEIKGLARQIGAQNYILAREAREQYRTDIV